MSLGEKIKEARAQRNISQEELAHSLGVSRQAVSKWENGTAEPHGINREMLNQILELNIQSDSNDMNNEFEYMKKKLHRNKVLFLGILGFTFIILIILLVLLVQSNTSKKSKRQKYELEEINAPDYLQNESNTQNTDNLQEVQNGVASILFYDADANVVEKDAGWYNMAYIQYMVISWVGQIPETVEIYLTPTGSNTIEEKHLVVTKATNRETTSILINLESLRYEGLSCHMTLTLNYGESAVSVGDINVIYDTEIYYDIASSITVFLILE